MLCLQPVCDSVRLGGSSRVFLFCLLDKAEDGKPFTFCVPNGKSEMVKLKYVPKAFNAFVSTFKAGTDEIYVQKDENDKYVFKDVMANTFEWVAELKTAHAQRAAEQFGRELSRVGLTESEWLRLNAK